MNSLWHSHKSPTTGALWSVYPGRGPPDPNLDTRLTPGTQLSGKLSHLRAGAARLGMPIARRKLP